MVDASFVVESLFSRGGLFLKSTSDRPRSFRAPHLLDAEVGQVIRRYYLDKTFTEFDVSDARRLFLSYRILRYPHGPLLERALEFKHNITLYDGLYVALAEALRIPLLTCDGKLASAINKMKIDTDVRVY